jgi:hypothetical protein
MSRVRPLLFVLVVLPFLTIRGLAQGGQTGLSFLKLGVGGRSVAMGEAHAALANDASATYFNPAGLVEGEKVDILIMHKEWFQDIRTEYLGVALPFGNFALGLGINTTNVGEIELRTRPGPPEGTFSSHDFALSASMAMKVSPALNAGISVKYLYEKIFVDETSGIAADVGLLYKPPLEGLKFAVVGSNIGSMREFRTEKVKLPALLRVGASYNRGLDRLHSSLTMGTDFLKVFREEKVRLHTGAEINYEEKVAFRAGYTFGYETRGMTFGIGISRDILRLDYAFTPQSQDFRSGHTISIGVQL